MTPTRNEAWIIKEFLAAARLWASDIVVADQGSTDGTLERLQSTPGVHTVINDSPVFDESHRQRLVLNRARQIPGKRILIGLDADEALSSNFSSSDEWKRLGEAKPGTILRFRWVNVLPGFREAWIAPQLNPLGFVDDGSDHFGQRIHSPRVPLPEGAPVMDFEEIVVLHFQYVLWERMVSKQRWYQAWERITYPERSALQIYRHYNHMRGGWEKSEIQPLRPEWLEAYERAGVDFRSLKCEQVTWWDREVVQMLCEHGSEHFRKVAIWDKDWNALAHAIGQSGRDLSDPRSAFERVAHRVLGVTQGRRENLGVRAWEAILRRAGW